MAAAVPNESIYLPIAIVHKCMHVYVNRVSCTVMLFQAHSIILLRI